MSVYLLIIPGRLPGINEYTEAQRANLHQGASMKHKAQEKVVMCIKAQLHGLHIKRQVRLHYKFVEPNRKRDKDNISGFAHKVVQDALVQTGVLKNDGWNEIDNYTDDFAVDGDRPHIEVNIEEVE